MSQKCGKILRMYLHTDNTNNINIHLEDIFEKNPSPSVLKK